MSKIELENISYIYSRGTPFEKAALKNVDLSFSEGKITGLIGHTGSGKSTLVQMLNGILKPTEGRVLIDGVDIWAEPKKIGNIRHKVGLVFQYPEYQLFEETVYKDIAFGPANMKLSPEEIDTRVRDSIMFTGLSEEILEKSPFELSGGQKRRVAIAGVMAMRPDVLILDEPAAGLDPMGREEILGGIWSYQRKAGNTVIIVSHSMEDMAKYCDNIVLMKGARVIKTGTVSEIFAEPALLYEAGLTMPAAAKIAERLLEKGIPLSGELYTVEGLRDAILQALAQKN